MMKVTEKNSTLQKARKCRNTNEMVHLKPIPNQGLHDGIMTAHNHLNNELSKQASSRTSNKTYFRACLRIYHTYKHTHKALEFVECAPTLSNNMFYRQGRNTHVSILIIIIIHVLPLLQAPNRQWLIQLSMKPKDRNKA